MNKSTINYGTIVQMGSGVVCCLLDKGGEMVFYSKNQLTYGYPGGMAHLKSYDENLVYVSENLSYVEEYSIVAYYQHKYQNQAIFDVMNDSEFDWIPMENRVSELFKTKVKEEIEELKKKIAELERKIK